MSAHRRNCGKPTLREPLTRELGRKTALSAAAAVYSEMDYCITVLLAVVIHVNCYNRTNKAKRFPLTYIRVSSKIFCIYTGWNRRNGPNFGRVFLMLNYTEKTQNTYIQS